MKGRVVMKKLISVLLLLCLLLSCVPLAGAEDLALQAPTVKIYTDLPDEGGIPVVYSGVPTKVRFTVLDEKGNDPWDEDKESNLVAKYTVIRDSDGADVTVIPKSNAAVERTTTYHREMLITDGKKMTPGSYTIKVKIICTNKGYKDSPETTQKFIVSATKAGKTGTITITNGDQSSGNEYPRFKKGEQVVAAISAPGSSTCSVYCSGKYYPITLDANGNGTFISDPITSSSSYGYIYLEELDGINSSYDQDEYQVEGADITVTSDKKAYMVGDTARITITCAGTDYFYASTSFKEKKEVQRKERNKNAVNAYYRAVSGSATIEIPVTEAGWLQVDVDAYDSESHWLSNAWEDFQVDSPENIAPDSADMIPPTDIKIVPSAEGGLDLSWAASASANGYTVYRADSDEGIFNWLGTTTTTSFTDTEVPAKKVVYYRIVSRKETADGRRTVSGSQNKAPFKSYMLMAKPGKVKIKVEKAKTLGLSWKKVSGAEYYEVYYTTSKDKPTASTKPILTVKNGETSVNATKKVKSGKTYYVYVRAVTKLSDGTKVISPWSKAAKKKTK